MLNAGYCFGAGLGALAAFCVSFQALKANDLF